MKQFLTVLFLLASAACADDTLSISSLSAKQRYPWNGLVDIDFDLTCANSNAEIILSFSALDREHTNSLSMTTLYFEGKRVTNGLFGAKGGSRRLTWDAGTDAAEVKSSRVVISAEALGPRYIAYDLSGGTRAETYPLSFLASSSSWGDTYKTSQLLMRLILPGTYTMGSPTGEVGRDTNANNENQQEVTISSPFYIGVFQLTQRQWQLVTGTRPSSFNLAAAYATRPVENISYDDIRGSSDGAQWPSSTLVDETSFLGKLRSRTANDGIDLPTETQWEYACRAGSTNALNSNKNLSGTGIDPNMGALGRYYGNTKSESPNSSADTSSGTQKVGSYQPNAWGLYDMHGNVWELCLDWYTASISSSSDDTSDSESADDETASLATLSSVDIYSPTSGAQRVIRGGGWNNMAWKCRSAIRNAIGPADRSWLYGCRLACDASFLSQNNSASLALDTRSGTRTVAGGDSLAYSTAWFGSASCSLAANGNALTNYAAAAEGFYSWQPAPGSYALTFTAGTNLYTASYTVLGSSTAGGIPYLYSVSNGVATICGVATNDLPADLALPSSLDGYPVGAVGTNAFAGFGSLVSLTVPPGITNLDATAFANCANLKSVTIYPTVTNVAAAFPSAYAALTNITLAGTWTSFPSNEFAGCAGLASFAIPESVTNIGATAFAGCPGIRSVTITPAVTNLPAAFPDAYGLITNVTFAGTWQTISPDEFSGCAGLPAIVLPPTVTNIGERAFAGTGLTAIDIPQGVTAIATNAFGSGAAACALASVAFDAADGSLLASLPASKVTSLTLGENAAGLTGESLAAYAALTSFTIAGGSTRYSKDPNGALFSSDRTELIRYPAGRASAAYQTYVPATLRQVDSYAFAYAGALETVDLSATSVTNLGDHAFLACTNLQSVLLPATVTAVGDGAFGGCGKLESVSFAGDAPAFGSDVFGGRDPFVIIQPGTAGWNEAAALYGLNLYLANGITVAFDANGGGACYSNGAKAVSGLFPIGGTYGSLPLATNGAQAFAGWFTARAGGARIAATNTVSDKVTRLYAQWAAAVVVNGVSIPAEWIVGQGLAPEGADLAALEAAAGGTGANGLPVWESYVAGLAPTNPASRLLATIAVTNGVTYVGWKPDLGSNRAYTVEGKTNLADKTGWFSPTNAAARFFKVRVDLKP